MMKWEWSLTYYEVYNMTNDNVSGGYFGIFSCYDARQRCGVPTLIMAGTFTPQDLYMVNLRLTELEVI